MSNIDLIADPIHFQGVVKNEKNLDPILNICSWRYFSFALARNDLGRKKTKVQAICQASSE